MTTVGDSAAGREGILAFCGDQLGPDGASEEQQRAQHDGELPPHARWSRTQRARHGICTLLYTWTQHGLNDGLAAGSDRLDLAADARVRL